MEKEKKVVLFVHNGVISGGFTSDTSIHVTVCDFDSDMDDQTAENVFWDQCETEGMTQFEPEIYHPAEKED